ncbi:MAG: DUF2274 domain-containing protein [Pseudomonadota bacterium]
MQDTKLKIGQIPDQTPVKLTIPVPPALEADLKDYVRVYRDAYGTEIKVADIIPRMLQAFMDSDSGFKRARKQLGVHS